MTDHGVTLLQAVPYVRMYKGKVFVVKVGGSTLLRKDLLEGLAVDLACLHHLGMKVVLVHGGGPQASELSKRLGLEPRLVAGRRVTDEKVLDVVKMAFGLLNTDLTAALCAHGAGAVGLTGVGAGLIRARRRSPVRVSPGPGEAPIEVDYGLVGDVEAVEPSLLSRLLEEGRLPVLCPLVSDGKGSVFNLNADTLACSVAQALGAEKLLFLTDADGVLRDAARPETLVSYADIPEIEALRDEGRISGGMLPKVEACIGALRGGVRRTHVLSGLRRGGLLTEVFTNAGCGTLIVDRREREVYQVERVQEPVP